MWAELDIHPDRPTDYSLVQVQDGLQCNWAKIHDKNFFYFRKSVG